MASIASSPTLVVDDVNETAVDDWGIIESRSGSSRCSCSIPRSDGSALRFCKSKSDRLAASSIVDDVEATGTDTGAPTIMSSSSSAGLVF